MYQAMALMVALVPNPLDDLHRFPPEDVAKQAWQTSQSHLYALTERMNNTANLLHADAMDAWHRDQLYCYRCWNELDNAYRMAKESRLEALQKLRTLLGERDYLAGKMPPWTPAWHYVRID